MSQDMLADSVERLLADHCTAGQVRAIEAGAPADGLWQRLQDSGFLDALVPEPHGGAGLSLTDAFPLLYLCGRYAVPVPFAQTLVARALLAGAGLRVPVGSIALAISDPAGADGTVGSRVPFGRVAEWVLMESRQRAVLLSRASAEVTATGVNGSLEADMRWRATPADAEQFAAPLDLRAVGACVYAAQLAGAMARVLDITVRYANERTQFGRPIAKFQAIQHQLAVMAEHVVASRMAAEMSCRADSYLPDPMLAALGKARTSEAAVSVAAIGHAVHGAMGFTDEYELQLYTRRLHEWRLAYGSEAYWNERIGNELLTSNDSALDFIRGGLFPTA